MPLQPDLGPTTIVLPEGTAGQYDPLLNTDGIVHDPADVPPSSLRPSPNR